MSEHFDWPQVNHYLWRRQGFAWDQGGGAGRLLDEVIGVYATSPTGYLTLLAREAAFRFADLDDALYAARRAVRMRAMRYSNFIIPIRSLPAVYQATKRDQANPFKELLRLGMTEAQYEDAARQIEELLADGATRTAAEVRKALPADITAVGPAFGYVLPQMCEEARLVRARVRGGWKSDLYEYARFDHWLPDVHLDEVSPEDGQMELARLYFDAYGPASADDFRWWSGFTKAYTDAALAALGEALGAVQVGDTELWMLAARLDDLRACPADPPPGVRLLPVWDA